MDHQVYVLTHVTLSFGLAQSRSGTQFGRYFSYALPRVPTKSVKYATFETFLLDDSISICGDFLGTEFFMQLLVNLEC